MAVKIRLKRMGAKKRPFYRIVVADARSPRDGRFIESVGYYDPLREPKVVKLEDERIRHWIATGAKPSDAVRELMERAGMLPVTPRPARAGKDQPTPQPAAAAPATEPEAVSTAEGAVDNGEGTEPAAASADESAAETGPEAEG